MACRPARPAIVGEPALPCPSLCRPSWWRRGRRPALAVPHQAHLPAQPDHPQAAAWLPGAHEHQEWPPCAAPPPRQGPAPPVSVSGSAPVESRCLATPCSPSVPHLHLVLLVLPFPHLLPHTLSICKHSTHQLNAGTPRSATHLGVVWPPRFQAQPNAPTLGSPARCLHGKSSVQCYNYKLRCSGLGVLGSGF